MLSKYSINTGILNCSFKLVNERKYSATSNIKFSVTAYSLKNTSKMSAISTYFSNKFLTV
jgi:hypothetical protein